MIEYNSEDSIKLFNFVKNNFEWNSIELWQDNKDKSFPEKIIKKNINEDEINGIIEFLMCYPIIFDIGNKDKKIDDDFIYKKRIEHIKKQINLFKPIKNPDITIFKIFEQPLFDYFVNKNVPKEAIDSFKFPNGIFSKTLIPRYDNFIDKNLIKTEYLLMYNDKNVLISDSKYSSAMSFTHLLCIPNRRIYNCVTLKKKDISLLKTMTNDTQNYFNINYLECLSEFGTRCLNYMLENTNKVVNNYDLIERNDISESFIIILNNVYNKYINMKNYNIKDIYKNLLNELDKNNFKNNDKKLEFYFHIHPFHGIGYIHIQCIYEPLKTKSWNHFILQFIKVDDVIKTLENS